MTKKTWADVIANHARWWRALPPLQITLNEALELREYSATNPTGTTIGKRWRRHDGSFDHEFIAAGGMPRWVICEYAESEKGPGWVKTLFYRPVIRAKAWRAS